MEDNLRKIAGEIGDLLEVKNKAYGSSTSMTFEIFGMEAYLVRMYDKINRATNLVKNNAECNDESLEDTLRDLAGYAILAINELQKRAKPYKIDEDRIKGICKITNKGGEQ